MVSGMLIGWKDGTKLTGILVIVLCAVLVCTMFLNYYIDVSNLREEIETQEAMAFYEAQLMTAKVVCLVSGGCLFVTSVIMLIFYIRHYADTHKKELGILKALGYSNLRISGHFGIFGVSVLIGALLGYAGAFLLMPSFYRMQNKEEILPDTLIHFHPTVPVAFIILPTLFFSLLAVFCAYRTLKQSPLMLLRDQSVGKIRRHGKQESESHFFIADLKKSTLKSQKALVFFIFFSAFCFSAMTQMSFSMKDLASPMMGAMILLIGLVLACVTLFLALNTVVRGNAKAIAMMKVFGYSAKECQRALLDGYRPVAYIGFAIGTVYQYGLLRVMVDLVFRDIAGVPEYTFDVPMMILSLAVFVILYEAVMAGYASAIRKAPVKDIMME